MNLEQIIAALQKAMKAVQDFQKGIVDDKGEARSMTKEEREAFAKLLDEVEGLKSDKELAERAQRQQAELGSAVNPETKGSNTLPAQPKVTDDDAKKFKNFGGFLQAVAADGMNKGSLADRDPRLVFEKAAGANEAIPSEGGFLVQEDFSTALLGLAHDMGDVMSRVRKLPISANSNAIKLPVIDETSRVDGSRWGGIQSYWADEGETVSSSKPKFRHIELSLKKLMGIGYITEEMLRDGPFLEAVMMQAFAEEITFMTEDAIINGNGAGKPLGILNSGALITVPKETSQAADTLTGWNVLNMMARLPVRSMRSAVWLTNQDALPQLWGMTHPVASNILMYQPPGLSNNIEGNAPYGTLMGRPVIPVEHAATVGDAGDLMLFDLNQYLLIDKGGVNAATSMHVRFLYDEMTFRITYRVDGQPTIRVPVTPKNGTKTQSPFVVLAARS